MKATIEFNLPEESAEHRIFMTAMEANATLCEVDNYLRSTIKHSECELRQKLAQEIRDLIPADLLFP